MRLILVCGSREFRHGIHGQGGCSGRLPRGYRDAATCILPISSGTEGRLQVVADPVERSCPACGAPIETRRTWCKACGTTLLTGAKHVRPGDPTPVGQASRRSLDGHNPHGRQRPHRVDVPPARPQREAISGADTHHTNYPEEGGTTHAQ